MNETIIRGFKIIQGDKSMIGSVQLELLKKDKDPCPICGKPSHELQWKYFNSDPQSWKMLAGREGFTSHCPKCNIDVQTIITSMS